jgi:hypothetical protein
MCRYIDALNRLVRFLERHGKWQEASDYLRELVDDPLWPRSRRLTDKQKFTSEYRS